MNRKTGTPRRVTLALVAVGFLFGINFSTTKTVVSMMPPLVWASARAWVAAAGLFLFAHRFAGPPPKINREFVTYVAFLSIFGVVINQGTLQVGLSLTSTTNSAILTTLTPVFTLILVGVAGIERIQLRTVLGFLFAMVGALFLNRVEDLRIGSQTLIGDGLIVASSLSYAVFLVAARRFMGASSQVWVTAWLFAFGALGLTLLSIPYWNEIPTLEFSSNQAWAATYVIFGGTLLPYLLTNWSLARTESSTVALFSYIQPVVACAIGAVFLGEALTLRILGAGCLIFVGFAICVSRPSLSR